MHHAPALHFMDYLGPAVAAVIFVTVMALLQEPLRHKLNVLLAAGATGVYLSGGLGVWELVFPLLALPLVYLGLRSYRFIAVAWLMHAAWDLVHHVYGNAIWPFMPTSSFGCLIFDGLIALWLMRLPVEPWTNRPALTRG
jgi:hypothetical protein